MMSVGGYHEYTGGVQYTGGYHEYTGGVQYTGSYHEYTGGIPRCMWGVIMSTPGGVQYTGRDTMSTPGFRYE